MMKERRVELLEHDMAMTLTFTIEAEQEADGRWIAEVMEIPGTMVYGATTDEAVAQMQALALRVLAERLENGEAAPDFVDVSFRAASPSTGLRPEDL